MKDYVINNIIKAILTVFVGLIHLLVMEWWFGDLPQWVTYLVVMVSYVFVDQNTDG